MRGAEARLLVRGSLDFLRSLGYDVVEQFVVPTSSRPVAKNGQGPPPFGKKGRQHGLEVRLLKGAALLATLATVAKILFDKWRDLF